MKLSFFISPANLRDTEAALKWESQGRNVALEHLCFATMTLESTINRDMICLADVPALLFQGELLHFLDSNRHKGEAITRLTSMDQEFTFDVKKNDEFITFKTVDRTPRRVHTHCPTPERLRVQLESFLAEYILLVPNLILSSTVKRSAKSYGLNWPNED